MRNKPSLWFDCDGVLLDWTRPFLRHAGHSVSYEDLRNYDNSVLYADPSKLPEDISSFHYSPEFAFLPPIVNPAYLWWLKKTTGAEMNVITQIEDEEIPRNARLFNLKNIFGEDCFDAIHFTVRGQDKLEYISQRRPNDAFIIIEDHPVTLSRISNRIKNDLIDRGHTNVAAFGVQHPYNREALLPLTYIQQVKDTSVAIAIIKEIVNDQNHFIQ